VQQYREVYDIVHPLQQTAQPRRLRLSPFCARQQEQGAVFFESAGCGVSTQQTTWLVIILGR
jgi:hypothetical protein